MFKKQITVSAQNPISNKDRKAIQKILSRTYNAEVTEKIFNNNEKIISNKVKGKKTKIMIYANETYPLFIDATDKGDFLPTTHLLQAYPTFVKSLILNQGVEEFIYNGASLMWPGVDPNQDLGDYKASEIRVILNSQKKAIAIGEMVADREEAEQDKNGVACFILTWKGDALWQHFQTQEDIEQVYPYPEDEEEEEIDMSQFIRGGKPAPKKQENQEKDLNSMLKNKAKKNKKKVDNIESEEEETKEIEEKKVQFGMPQKEELEEDAFENKKKGKKGKGKAATKSKKDKIEVSDGEENYSEVQQIDAHLKEALMNALKLSIQDKQLPIDSSQVYSTHMMQCKPANVNLDIKLSSYKKIGKFFQVMSKDGLIDYKEPKKNTAAMISKIHRNNPELENFEPTIYEINKKSNQSQKDDSKKVDFKLNQIEELYKHKQLLEPILGKLENDQYLTQTELKNKKPQIGKKNYQLNEFIYDLLSDQEKQDFLDSQREKKDNEDSEEEPKTKEQIFPVYSKEQIWNIIQTYVSPFYKVIPGDKNKKIRIYAGQFKGVKLIAEKVHNKNVTKCSGLDQFGMGLNLESLQNIWIKKYACSVSIHEVPGGKKADKEKEHDIHVHGNFLTDLQDDLQNEYKIPEKYITTQDKLNKKKEKGMRF